MNKLEPAVCNQITISSSGCDPGYYPFTDTPSKPSNVLGLSGSFYGIVSLVNTFMYDKYVISMGQLFMLGGSFWCSVQYFESKPKTEN